MKTRDPERAIRLTLGFLNEVGIIAQLSSTALQRTLPPGMTLAQFGVLNHFARLGGQDTPARLAAAFQVTKGAMTNTLQKLEKKEFISIQADPNDGRRKLVKATAKGRRMRDRALASFTPTLLEIANDLSPQDLANALPFLERVRIRLDRARNQQDFEES